MKTKIPNSKLLIFLTILFFGVFGMAESSLAMTINSASCEQPDVQTAVNAADDGDMVIIPACLTTQWSAPLNISKAITLQGAGKIQTLLQWNGARGAVGGATRDVMIRVVPESNKTVRITGLSIDMVAIRGESGNSTERIAIYVGGSTNNTYAITNLRIDNNAFNKGGYTIEPRGYVEGVIDNNTFINPGFAVGCIGDNDNAWARGLEAGTEHMLFIENNTVIYDSNLEKEPPQTFGHGNGCRTVIRYNTVDGTANTNYNTFFLDIHGNQGNGGALPAYYLWKDARGDPIHEVYNNKVSVHHASGNNLGFLRSGSLLMYNNNFNVITGIPSFPYLYEEEGWYCPPGAPASRYLKCRTIDGTSETAGLWPGMDQITNTNFWNNTCNWSGTQCNGGYITSVAVGGNAQTDFIQEGRDYHLHAPQTSGSKSCTYGNNLYRGHSATYPTDGSEEPAIAKQLTTLTCTDGADFHYPYVPYACPHPLTGLIGTCDSSVAGTSGYNTANGDTTAPNAPAGLSVR